MIKPNKLKKGDCIGVVAPSSPIIGERAEDIKRAHGALFLFLRHHFH